MHAGDDSDYEDEVEDSAEQTRDSQDATAAAAAAESAPMPDHPDYYGRGFRPEPSIPLNPSDGAAPNVKSKRSLKAGGSRKGKGSDISPRDSHSHGGGDEDEEDLGEGSANDDENGEDVWGGYTDGESAWREVEAQAAAGREQGLVGAGKTQVSCQRLFTCQRVGGSVSRKIHC